MSDQYESVGVSREQGRGVVVDRAPAHTKFGLPALLHNNGLLEVPANDRVTIASQVQYRITGWDPSDGSLTAELVEDWRPGEAIRAES